MVETRSSSRKSCTPEGMPVTTPAVGSKRTGSTASLPKPKKSKRESKKGDEKVQVTIEEALSKENGGDSSKDDVELKDDHSQYEDEYGNPSLAESQMKNGAEEIVQVPKDEEMIVGKNNDETRDEVNGNSHIKHGANGLTGCTSGFAENVAQKIGLNGEIDESTKAEEAATMQIRKPSDAGRVNKIEPGIDRNSCKPDAKEDERSDENPDLAVTKEAAVEKSSRREDSTPSSILEKGIIYFFFRGRVNMEEPSNVGDIARSYIVLRPIPNGAKIGNGPIEDAGTNRLLALPKKVLPNTSKDRFMVFVEKANASLEEIKSSLGASDYLTKTAGARHTPSATPVGVGVYAIIKAGRESHLAYILTIPSELGGVQKDIGLRHRGSFVTTAKNPHYPGPRNTKLSESPTYPREIIDDFRGLRWMPLQPKLLQYTNTQFLIIGHSSNEIENATELQPKDQANEKDSSLEELENLENEDELRVEHLKGDDSVFVDLGLSFDEYPKQAWECSLPGRKPDLLD